MVLLTPTAPNAGILLPHSSTHPPTLPAALALTTELCAFLPSCRYISRSRVITSTWELEGLQVASSGLTEDVTPHVGLAQPLTRRP